MFALAVVGAAALAAPCPKSVAYFQAYSPATQVFTAAVTYDQTFTDTHTAHMTYDRGAAQATMTATSGGRCTASLRVIECFDVTGVPAGTPVDGVLEARFDGWAEQNCGGAGCGVRADARLRVGADSLQASAGQSGPGYSRIPLSATLGLPVHFVAGAPVEGHVVFDYGTGPGQNGASAEFHATWGISGLPPGVHAIASSGSDVTPARRPTWGAIKTLYR